MVLTSSGVELGEVRLLPPALPALLIERSHQSRSRYVCRPRAEATASSSSGDPPSSSAPSTSRPVDSVRFSLPAPRIASWGVGLGVGGASFIGRPAKATALLPLGGGSKNAATPNTSGKKRILIMMSNTGGGHKASAEAIKQAFEEKYGDNYEFFIVDMWKEHTPSPFSNMPDSYSFLVRHGTLWRLSYEITQPRWFHVPYLRTVGLFISRGLARAFDQYNPDLVVSVHPLMQHVPLRVLRSRIRSGVQRPINFATVVTDFTTCHNTWFHKDVTRCFVPTAFCANLAKRMGLQEGQLVQHGLPIRPVFSKHLPSKRSMRRQLGLDPDTPAVLLVGGGEGMGALEETVDRVAARLGAAVQVAVICGRNVQLVQKLKAKRYESGMSVLPVGFVNNVHEFMHACDVIVTKAGPGTIAEALISGLPILLNGNVPCQEEGNIPYVIDNEVGAFETRPQRIADILHSWLLGDKREAFKAMGPKAKTLGRPEAVYRIAADLAKLASELDPTYGPGKWAQKAGAGGANLAAA